MILVILSFKYSIMMAMSNFTYNRLQVCLWIQEDTCNYITSQMCDPNDQDAHQPVLQGQQGVGHGHIKQYL